MKLNLLPITIKNFTGSSNKSYSLFGKEMNKPRGISGFSQGAVRVYHVTTKCACQLYTWVRVGSHVISSTADGWCTNFQKNRNFQGDNLHWNSSYGHCFSVHIVQLSGFYLNTTMLVNEFQSETTLLVRKLRYSWRELFVTAISKGVPRIWLSGTMVQSVISYTRSVHRLVKNNCLLTDKPRGPRWFPKWSSNYSFLPVTTCLEIYFLS